MAVCVPCCSHACMFVCLFVKCVLFVVQYHESGVGVDQDNHSAICVFKRLPSSLYKCKPILLSQLLLII